MRHAKSSWADAGLTDFDRPLNKRGLRVAPQMGEFVHLQGIAPDLVISSTANRAKSTAMLFAEACEGVEKDQLTFTAEFYHAPASIYVDQVLAMHDESVNVLMFVGHNPGMEELVETLSGCWEPMPTAAIACFDLGIESWDELQTPLTARLKHVWRPKELDIR